LPCSPFAPHGNGIVGNSSTLFRQGGFAVMKKIKVTTYPGKNVALVAYLTGLDARKERA
jgi:hypothetical protein